MKKCSTSEKLLFKVMKVCSLQGLLATMLVSIAAGHTNYAQLLDKKVTLDLKDIPLETVLKAIEAQVDVKFFYSHENVDLDQKVTIEATDKPLKHVMRELFDPLGIKYNIHERTASITIRMKTNDKDSDNNNGGTHNGLNSAKNINTALITGRVTDAQTSQPIAGVNVIVKGSLRGTATDAEGRYVIDANPRDLLVFSFIGFKSVEVGVNMNTVIDIAMETDIKSLEAVEINAGYWQVNNRERTGNISRITEVEIAKQPVSNPLQTMQGRMPGIYIQQTNGVPGSNFTVRIRGQNSLLNGNDPLYVIDGVPFVSQTLSSVSTAGSILGAAGASPLNSINPNDIESIEILKDADATAIYGSRGANGVVLITTKRGQSGRLTVDVNAYMGASKVANKMDLLGTEQYVAMRKEAYTNDGIPIMGNGANDLLKWDTTRYTDWQKELIGGTANTTNVYASASAGNEQTRFIISGDYRSDGTVYPGEFKTERLSSHFSLVHASVDEKFKATFSFAYVNNRTNFLNTDLTTTSLQLAPNAPALYDEFGNLNWQNATWQNPLRYLNTTFKQRTNNLIANAVLSYELFKGFEIKSSFGLNDVSNKEIKAQPSTFINPQFNPTPELATSRFNDNSLHSWIIEPQASWNKSFGDSKFSILVGATFQDRSSEALVQQAFGFSSDALIEDVSAAYALITSAYDNIKYRYSALFARLNYDWKGKYILNLTGRRDGSSRFGPGKQFGNFGAVGAAWIFSEENFLADKLSFLSLGKLRVSYGTNGNDQIGDYRFIDTYSPVSASYGGITGLAPTSLFNPDLSWEVNKKFEVAAEFGFFDDRLQVAGSYYRNRSSNQLVNYSLATTTGFTGINSNLPATIQNTGVEIELNSTNIRRNNFQWTTSFNMTFPRNELLEFQDLENSSYANRYEIGKPITIAKRYHSIGVNPDNGYHTFEDINKDGAVNFSDAIYPVIVGQKYYGGLNNSFTIYSVQLDIFFQFVKQTGANYWSSSSPWPGQSGFNQSTEVLVDHWTSPGQQAKNEKFTTLFNPGHGNFITSDAAYSDASFIRLKNVSVSYQLPEKWTDDVKCRIYVQGQNLLTFTDYFGLDPENTNSSNLPPLRMISGGVRVTF